MKLNAKDIASGLFLILVALVGLYINGGLLGFGLEQHALGSARRMGPGYMPMLVFWLQIVLGTVVLLIGLANGPDPLEKWTGLEIGSLVLAAIAGGVVYAAAPYFGEFFTQTYNGLGLAMLVGFLVLCWAAGWRLLGYVCAAMAFFSLTLEKGGLMVALIGTIGIAALADPDHRARPLGVLGLTIFLLALCWWIFIKELDIRVAVWPVQY